MTHLPSPPAPSTWDHPSAPPRPVAPPPPPVVEDAPVKQPWAPWWRRVCATLLDSAFLTPFVILWVIGFVMMDQASFFTLDGTAVGVERPSGFVAGLILAIAARIGLTVFNVWNVIHRQGKYGWSLGKETMGIMVVGIGDGKPIGRGLTIVRNLLHLLDALPLGLGYLWPLWDERKQTFADKILGTCVLDVAAAEQQRIPQQRTAWTR